MKLKFPLNIYFQRYLGLVASFFAVFILSIGIIRFFILSPGQVNGRSMELTFIDNDYFLVDKFSYLFAPPERYDVVQIVDPIYKKLIIKRIVGLPGETIIIKRGKVYVKSVQTEDALPEPYLKPHTITKLPTEGKPLEVVLGPHEYFVLGDNRDYSTDSRHYGAVHRQVVVGKIIGDF